MKKIITVFIVFTFIAFNSCKTPKDKTETHTKEHATHWSYNGETAPVHWVEIEKNSDCNGNKQSPINIIDIDAKPTQQKVNPLNILYTPSTELKQVINNGHSIQFDFEAGDSIQYHGNTYYLSQLHFHEPSEHTIDGIRYPLEIHMVHKSKFDTYTVMSILAKEGVKSQLFEFFESFLPIKVNTKKEIHQSSDLATLFPKNKNFYAYGGSLTTPPCTETVNWIVFKDPIIISVDEVLKLKSNMPMDNFRNEQALNNRVVSLNSYN